MDLRCFICRRKVDIEEELTLFFECHVYCERCLRQMEGKERTPPSGMSEQEFPIPNVQ